MKFQIGHASYQGANALKIVSSGTAAIAELQSRGVVRQVARDAIKRAQTVGPTGVLSKTANQSIEVEALKPVESQVAAPQ